MQCFCANLYTYGNLFFENIYIQALFYSTVKVYTSIYMLHGDKP